MTTSLHRERYWLGAAVLAGVALVWYWPAGDSPAPAAAPAVAPAPHDTFGLARWNSGPRQPSELPLDDQLAPSSLSTDASGKLVVDAPLRVLFEFFLVRGDGADLDARAAQLRAHLERQVSGAAGEQAGTLAARYTAYMRAHDELLASQRIALAAGSAPTAQQVEQLATWQQQRARLRQSTFGPAIAGRWFGADDAELAQAVADLRARADASAGGGNEADPDSNTLRERRLHDATWVATRDTDTGELLARATQSYEAAAGEERAWRAHYLRYRADAALLTAAAGTDARRRQLEALQARIFPNERERIRARASGIE
ncbi:MULTISPECIES: lipase secretion chaperone [unclassified Duganella]|uniref:lipase secretion chaperone n=1 Tax=unclassified Duganella TaxID=2636909 RepID=UPI00131493C7|nr:MULTISPECIES: lipase secretion chaperone [unclassified Duganella]